MFDADAAADGQTPTACAKVVPLPVTLCLDHLIALTFLRSHLQLVLSL